MTTQIIPFKSNATVGNVKRKFSITTDNTTWETRPLCPERYRGKEFVLFSYPIEVAILGTYVEPFVKQMQHCNHHVKLRDDWKTSHLVIDEQSCKNNPPPLGDVFKVLAYIGCTAYFVISKNPWFSLGSPWFSLGSPWFSLGSPWFSLGFEGFNSVEVKATKIKRRNIKMFRIV
jgi:hypothetical protein